jgi:hypothetical protein
MILALQSEISTPQITPDLLRLVRILVRNQIGEQSSRAYPDDTLHSRRPLNAHTGSEADATAHARSSSGASVNEDSVQTLARSRERARCGSLLLAICEACAGQRGGTCVRARACKQGRDSRGRRCPRPVVLRRSSADGRTAPCGEAIGRCRRRRTGAIRMRFYWRRHSGVGSPTLHRNPRAEISPRW